MKNLSKKNILKAKKQQLCDRINQCKSLKELEEWRKTFSYHSILKEDADWDYGYLLDLIEFKLKRMSQYFHTHNYVVNENWYGDLCDKAIAILNAGYKSKIITSLDLSMKGIYVNSKNKHRFYSNMRLMEEDSGYYKRYGLADIRIAKAKILFWKFMHHYIEYLWD